MCFKQDGEACLLRQKGHSIDRTNSIRGSLREKKLRGYIDHPRKPKSQHNIPGTQKLVFLLVSPKKMTQKMKDKK